MTVRVCEFSILGHFVSCLLLELRYSRLLLYALQVCDEEESAGAASLYFYSSTINVHCRDADGSTSPLFLALRSRDISIDYSDGIIFRIQEMILPASSSLVKGRTRVFRPEMRRRE